MNIQMMEYKGQCGLIKIVEQLEFCKYQTKDGLHDLKDNLAFQALKELAQERWVYEQVCLAECFKLPTTLMANLLIYRVTCSFCVSD